MLWAEPGSSSGFTTTITAFGIKWELKSYLFIDIAIAVVGYFIDFHHFDLDVKLSSFPISNKDLIYNRV